MQHAGLRDELAAWRDSIESLVLDDIAYAIVYAVGTTTRMNVAELIVIPTQQG